MTMAALGMTGFGRAEGARRLELGRGGPLGERPQPGGPVPWAAGFDGLERAAREGARARFQRGQVTVGLQAKRSEGAGAVRLNLEQLERYLDARQGLCGRRPGAAADPGRPPRPARGDRGGRRAGDPEPRPPSRRPWTASIAQALMVLRRAAEEGGPAHRVLSGSSTRSTSSRSKAHARPASRPAAIKERFQMRMTRAGRRRRAEDRIVQEAAALAGKADVREELDR
jgi:uncharacterized protein YicC (UPF0701 family)